MQCPKCKAEHKAMNDEGKLVARNITVCYMCGFTNQKTVKNTESEQKFIDHCLNLIEREVKKYKNSQRVDHLNAIEIFVHAAMLQAEDIEFKPEISD